MVNKNAKERKSGKGWIIALVVLIIIIGCFLFFGITMFLLTSLNYDDPIHSGNVAIIPIKGPIVGDAGDSFFGGDQLAVSSKIVEKIEKADKEHNIKAIILEVNSPGGSPVASDEIANALEATQKPTLVVIREVGASGAYWIASSADVIIAHEMSMVGSIGVIGSYLEFPGLLDRFNISYNQLISGKHKDIGTPYKHLEEEEKAMFQELLDELHAEFVTQVSQGRNMPREQVMELATGWVFTGRKGKELGLVDELGGMKEAIEIVERDLNITVKTVEYKTQPSLLDLIAGTGQMSSYHVGKGIGDSLLTQKEFTVRM